MVCAYVEQKKGKYSALAGVCINTYSSLVFVWKYEIECRLKSIRDLLFCKTIRIVTWVFANQNTLHGIPDTVPCWSQPCNIVANSNTNRVKDTPQSNTHAKFNFIQRTSTKKSSFKSNGKKTTEHAIQAGSKPLCMRSDCRRVNCFHFQVAWHIYWKQQTHCNAISLSVRAALIFCNRMRF